MIPMNDQIFYDYLMQFIGKPYVFGAEGPAGFDCSGFVQEILKSQGMDIQGDQNAQMYFDYFKDPANGVKAANTLGTLVFFGKSETEISHVAILLNSLLMIEAGGGDSTTTSAIEAEKRHAFVRVRPLLARRDAIAFIRPNYTF